MRLAVLAWMKMIPWSGMQQFKLSPHLHFKSFSSDSLFMGYVVASEKMTYTL